MNNLLTTTPRYDVQLLKITLNIEHTNRWRPLCGGRDDAGVLLQAYYKQAGLEPDIEHFGIIAMDARNMVNAIHMVSKGTTTKCVVDLGAVYRAAIMSCAVEIVCWHNHPSGNPTPSDLDEALHTRLCEAGDILGIPCIDHVILGWDSWVSMGPKGTLPYARSREPRRFDANPIALADR